jgi:hypothetical protein
LFVSSGSASPNGSVPVARGGEFAGRAINNVGGRSWHIGRSRQIECPTDQQAVDRAAKESGDYRAVQVWDGDRPRSPGEDFAHPSVRWILNHLTDFSVIEPPGTPRG